MLVLEPHKAGGCGPLLNPQMGWPTHTITGWPFDNPYHTPNSTVQYSNDNYLKREEPSNVNPSPRIAETVKPPILSDQQQRQKPGQQ
ncbi:hypothetical protein ACLB1O_29905 [Escherichia coli]